MSEPTLDRLPIPVEVKDHFELDISTLMENTQYVSDMRARCCRQREEIDSSGQWVNKQNSYMQAYEYLCHIGEAKQWIQICIHEDIGPIMQLEETLRDGIILARLANWFAPDAAVKIYTNNKQRFRNTDNINHFLNAIRIVRLPRIFEFELIDLYEKKNIPKVIYCIHALSFLLQKSNVAPGITSLVGKLQFTDEELQSTQRNLDSYSSKMPDFTNLKKLLAHEIGESIDGYTTFQHFDPSDVCSPTTPDLTVEGDDESELDSDDQKTPDEIEERTPMDQIFWKDQTAFVVRYQAAVRKHLARTRYQRIRHHYARNIEQIIRVQKFVKRKQTETAYRQLIMIENPTLLMIKRCFQLANDTELDIHTDLALQDMKQQIIEHIRENARLSSYLSALDVQIGLLLRQVITTDEVVAWRKPFEKKKQHCASEPPVSNMAASSCFPFSRDNMGEKGVLQLYQNLLYVLQSEPQYLARLLSMIGRQSLGESANPKLMESAVLALFGYAINDHDELLFIRFCNYCIQQELQFAESTQALVRGQCMFIKLVAETVRGGKGHAFFRQVFGQLIQRIMQDETLDLEMDPVIIYRKVFNDVEHQPCYVSSRPVNVSLHEAMSDDQVRSILNHHLDKLQEITLTFLDAIMETAEKIPLMIRSTARQLWACAQKAFPSEPQNVIARTLCSFIYYRFINPAIVSPEQFGIVDQPVLVWQRKNLGQIARMLQRVSSGQRFGDKDWFLKSLDDFVEKSSRRFAQWFSTLTDVKEAQRYTSEPEHSSNPTRTGKSTVCISSRELFYLHYIVSENIDCLDTEPNGHLRSIVDSLGPSPFRPDVDFSDVMLRLSLVETVQGHANNAIIKQQQLLADAKRLVGNVIQVQTGPNLRAIFDAPVYQVHEDAWQAFKAGQFPDALDSQLATAAAASRFVKISSVNALDLKALSFSKLKSLTARLIDHLAFRCGAFSANDNYQVLLNSIAQDIVSNCVQRQQRNTEFSRARTTLIYLKNKRQKLEEQQKIYEGYMNDCVAQNGKRQQYTQPYTHQYFCLHGVRKQDKVPCSGSFRYTAKELHDRGILIDVAGLSPKRYNEILVTLSMGDRGIVRIAGSCSRWTTPFTQVDLCCEELLLIRSGGAQTMTVLGGMAAVNVDRLISLVDNKFYSKSQDPS